MSLTCDEHFCGWNNNLKLQAAAQGIDDALNASFAPDSTDPDPVALFNEQQKCMISVFSSVLKTTKGKELVHQQSRERLV